jgi:ABC-type transporter Mla subunit MlaD
LDFLLTLFVALTAIAVMTQAGVLVAIYLVSKRHSEQIERFMNETRQMMRPIQGITENLRTASANIAEIGVSARDQFRRVEGMVNETSEVLHLQLARLDSTSREIVERVNGTAQVIQDSIIRPIREVAAIAKGFGRGLEAFFLRRQKSTVDQAHQDEELFI